MASIEVNGRLVEVPCQMGGRWTYAVDIDGELQPACVSTVRPGK